MRKFHDRHDTPFGDVKVSIFSSSFVFVFVTRPSHPKRCTRMTTCCVRASWGEAPGHTDDKASFDVQYCTCRPCNTEAGAKQMGKWTENIRRLRSMFMGTKMLPKENQEASLISCSPGDEWVNGRNMCNKGIRSFEFSHAFTFFSAALFPNLIKRKCCENGCNNWMFQSTHAQKCVPCMLVFLVR